jgi:hypothetical protein
MAMSDARCTLSAVASRAMRAATCTAVGFISCRQRSATVRAPSRAACAAVASTCVEPSPPSVSTVSPGSTPASRNSSMRALLPPDTGAFTPSCLIQMGAPSTVARITGDGSSHSATRGMARSAGNRW